MKEEKDFLKAFDKFHDKGDYLKSPGDQDDYFLVKKELALTEERRSREKLVTSHMEKCKNYSH